MTPTEFASAVLPPPGYGHYCVVELSSKKKRHVFVDTLEEVTSQADEFDAQHFNTFFAIATYENDESREAQNARYVKAFVVDVDCGGGHAYATPQIGVAALDAFITSTGLATLPNPIINATGGGLHAFWPLSEPVTIQQWKPVAECLKRVAKQHDFAIDHSVTADAARILRMPGTTNWKQPDNPRPCTTKGEGGGPATLDAFASAIGYNTEPVRLSLPALIIPGVRPKAADSAAGLMLMQNSAVYFKRLMVGVRDGKGCGQIDYYVNHAQDEGLEPLWRAVLSIAKPCEDGLHAARVLSALHPYDEDRMQHKLQDIKGPYPCTKFNTENPGVCEKCPYWGKIVNPLLLARETLTDTAPKQVEITAEPETVEQVQTSVIINRPPAPGGYAYGAHGGVYHDEPLEANKPDSPRTMRMVVPYDLFAINLMNRESAHFVHFVALRQNGPQNITLPLRATVTKDDMCKALSEQNIMASGGNDDRLYRYLRACITHASENHLPINVPTQFGWQKDDSFVCDSKIMAPGTEIITPLPGLENIVRVTKPHGTLEGWKHTVNLLTKYKMHDILAIMSIGFGAPLMRFTSFNGLTFHLGSSESGTGKSLALEMAASIWGHPLHYMVGKDTSGVAMQQRLGLLNSLPLICDEITQKNRLNFEWFPGFVFDMTDGKGKERMDGNVNRERTNTTYWSSLALVSSNTHVMDYLSSRKHSSQGEIMRLLELKMTTELDPPPDLYDAIKNMLPYNYGIAGVMFARWLADNVGTAQMVVREIEDSLKERVQKAPNERFWIGAVAACLAGAVLAGTGYANIVYFPVRGMRRTFVGMIESARHVARTSRRTADDVLNSYIREFFSKFVVVKKMDDTIEAKFGGNAEIGEGIVRSEICGRVEYGFKEGRTVFYIEEQLFKRFCSGMSFGYSDLKALLMAKYNAVVTKKDMLSGTRGPAMNVNVLKISVPSGGDTLGAAAESSVSVD